ncbi:MAG: hypothetical protein ACREHG_02095, partial [Candidatus Saccharimonadales bacterium]
MRKEQGREGVRLMPYGGQKGLSGKSELKIIDIVMHAMSVIWYFLLWPVVIIAMIVVHHWFPDSKSVAIYFAASGTIVAGMLWYFSHSNIVGKLHSIMTVAFLVWLIDYTDLIGFDHTVQFCMISVLPMLFLTWSIRAAAGLREDRMLSDIAGVFEDAGLGEARIQFFKNAKNKAGKAVRKVKGIVHMPSAIKTPEDLAKRKLNVEGGLHVPPGSMTVTQNLDHADWADFTISDPRTLRIPTMWGGPSHPFQSVDKPLTVGLWQDGEYVDWSIVGQHVQIMGMTGSGKSLGACWSMMAELVTRRDVVIIGADVTKGLQTLGPFADSLYRLETGRAGATQMLLDIADCIKPRTNYLAAKGLSKWQENCGLSYLVVWLEEAPEIIDGLGKAAKKRWTDAVKAARSAGITFVISLQRSDFSQMPTIARGQLDKWCFGVADLQDAKFGLSPVQKKNGATPELWAARQPGMAYLDASGIPEDRITMPMRTFYWTNDDSMIREHAEQYPYG